MILGSVLQVWGYLHHPAYWKHLLALPQLWKRPQKHLASSLISTQHTIGILLLSWIWLSFHHMDSCTTLQLHITPPQTTTPIIHCTYDTHIPIHHCTNHTAVTNHSLALIVSPHLHLIHTHTHISSTLPCTHREVLFSPVWHFGAFTLSVFPVVTWTVLTTLTICCLPFWPCLPCDILSVCRLPQPLHCPCWWFCLAFVSPVLVTELYLSDLLLFILIKLHLDLNATDPSHYRRLRQTQIQQLYHGYPA